MTRPRFHGLAIYFFTRNLIHYNQPNTRWRSNRPPVLLRIRSKSTSTEASRIMRSARTLSPNPHILALRGCCTTSSLIFVSFENRDFAGQEGNRWEQILPVFPSRISALDWLGSRLVLLLGSGFGSKWIGPRSADTVLSCAELSGPIPGAGHVGWCHICSRRRHVGTVRVGYGILLIIVRHRRRKLGIAWVVRRRPRHLGLERLRVMDRRSRIS